MINIILFIAYILVIICTAGALILPIIKLLDQPMKLLRMGMGIGAILALLFICWTISGNEVTLVYAKFDIAEKGSKLIGGMLIMMYALVIFAIIGIVYSELSKLFK